MNSIFSHEKEIEHRDSEVPLHTQDETISNLKKKNQDLEKLKFLLDFQLNDLKKQIEPQLDDISEKKEHIHQVCVWDEKDFSNRI